MKRIALLLTLLALPAMLLSCDASSLGGIGKYTMSKLPSKFKADLPDSIDNPSPSKSKSKVLVKKVTRANPGEDSTGCSQLKTMTAALKYNFENVAMMAVICDAVIAQNNIPADGAEYDGTVTLTAEMAETMKEIIDTDEDLSGSVGETVSGKITYCDNLKVTDDSPYKYSVTLVTDEDGIASSDVFYWSEDKNSTKLTSSYGTFTCEIAYNDETGYTKVQYKDTAQGLESLFTIQKTANGGSVFYCNDKVASGSNSFSYLIEGYADDNGGYVKTTVAQGTNTYKYSESFDADGKVVSGDTTYSDLYSSNESMAADFMTAMGVTVSVSGLAEGEYLVCTDDSPESDMSDVVGVGIAADGKLVIQDVSCGAYAAFESSTVADGTFYLKKMEVNQSDGSVEFTAAESYIYTR